MPLLSSDYKKRKLHILSVSSLPSLVLSNVYLFISKDSVLFEAFEASPLSEDILASKNVLRWDFLGAAVVILISEYEKTF
jgi:hypothetical protein